MSWQPPHLNTQRPGGLAIASFVIGVIGLVAWCIPCVGGPLTIVGLVLGIVGLNSPSRSMAIAGIVMNSISLLLTIVNAALGAYMAASGQHPLFQ